MDSFNPTTKTQQAISAAVQAATLAGNPDVGPTHLLGALLAQTDGIAGPLLSRGRRRPAAVRDELTPLCAGCRGGRRHRARAAAVPRAARA